MKRTFQFPGLSFVKNCTNLVKRPKITFDKNKSVNRDQKQIKDIRKGVTDKALKI